MRLTKADIDEVTDCLLLALPYLEDAAEDEYYNQKFIRKLVTRIETILDKVDKHDVANPI